MVHILFPLIINFIFSCISSFLTMRMIPSLIDKFLLAKRFGIDCHKKNKPKIPESFGIVTGFIFLVTCFIFMSIPFTKFITNSENVPHNEFVEMMASLLSICCMLLLGFADDIFDLRWRYKLFLPTLASLPLLVVYYVNFNSTIIILPKPLRHIIGSSLDLGFFYYLYMAMLAVFCTNAINIFSGINGLEVGQSVVIAVSILIFNLIELNGPSSNSHTLSMYFIMPFLAVSIPLLIFNWYPSKVFVGDTYCYFAGMLFAVVGILGHFSKTILLFFIPQMLNFLYSVPQLFHFIPCPRHRFPKFSADTELLEFSTVEFSLHEISVLGIICFTILDKLHLIKIVRRENNVIKCNNLTLLNIMLVIFGPTHEEDLTKKLLLIQVVCNFMAFMIRYPMVSVFYDV